MPGEAAEPVISELEEVWTSTIELGSSLDPGEWVTPTECPGWTVQDLVSHLIGIERMLLGETAPTLEGPVPAHVQNPLGEMNEAWVQARRSMPGAKVLAEFADVTERRVAELASFGPERFDEIFPSPIGEVPYRDFMTVRVYDSWVHEQDARLALGRPGGRGGAGERITLDRVSASMPYVIGRKVKPPEATTVVWEVSGNLARAVVVALDGGRGVLRDDVPKEPSVLIGLDAPTFWRLGCGRLSAGRAMAEGSVSLAGDEALGYRILEAMNFMF